MKKFSKMESYIAPLPSLNMLIDGSVDYSSRKPCYNFARTWFG